MGNMMGIVSKWRRKRRKVYLTSKGDDEDEELEGYEEEEYENLPYLLQIQATEHNYDETAERINHAKEIVNHHLNTVTKQSQQAIIEATIISTRKNSYANKETMTDMYPNAYILKSMTSRGNKFHQEAFVKKNQEEILSQIASLQTMEGVRNNEFIDDQVILHEHEAYFSTISYFLTNPDQPSSPHY